MEDQKLRTELIFTVKVNGLPDDVTPTGVSVWKSFIGNSADPEVRFFQQEPFLPSFQFSDQDFQLDFSDKFKFEVKFEDGSVAFATIPSSELARLPRLELQLTRNELPMGSLELETTTGITSETVYLKLKGVNLKDLDAWSKSDPYFQVIVPFQGSESRLYRSEVVIDNLDPFWRGFFLPKAYLNRDRRDVKIRIEVFDDDVGTSELIGACVTTLTQLLAPDALLVLHKNADGADSGPVTGRIKVEKAFACPTKTLVDYMRTGVEFAMSVAIDFSAKNRPQSDTKSLHNLTSESNSYLNALKCLSSFFRNFDSNGKYDLYGFGAKVGGSDYVNHFFPIASNVLGPEGVEQEYREVLKRLEFSSPCYLHTMLQNLILPYERRPVYTPPGPLVYNILVILTQGDLDDFEDFKDQLVRASNLPFSVVIVGVGNTAFPQLTTADSDRNLMKSASGHSEERDFVQRVIYTDFRGNDRGFLHEAFAEIPRQLQEFMMANKLA